MVEEILHHWQAWGRPEQQIPGNINERHPEGLWSYWLIQCGRGWGKTRTGGETVREWVKQGYRYVNLIGATADDARDIMVQGESGILSCCSTWERPEYSPTRRQLMWPNGATSLIFTADEPERLRGKQHDKLWADEIAAWRYAESWDQAKFGLRLGDSPQAVVTTTPRPTALIREIIADPGTIVTRGATTVNAANLAEGFLTSILNKYKNTRVGRQEIDGELLEDNPGALFKMRDIDQNRVVVAPQLSRVAVGVDPQASNNAKSAETGIIAAGIATINGVQHGYIIADDSLSASPEGWGSAAVKTYHSRQADRIVAEVNNGGDMVVSTILTSDRNVPVKKVTASRGKAIRAEPVAALYEQGRIHHVGMFAALEDQLVNWDPTDTSQKSPDRLDALVWVITELLLGDQNDSYLLFMKKHIERITGKKTPEPETQT